MIRITACIDEVGVLTRCEASGHAGAGARGNDIVCAAVSVLLRSMARSAAGKEGICVECASCGRGNFSYRAQYDPSGKIYLLALGTFLLEGLRSVAEEFPEYCSLIVSSNKAAPADSAGVAAHGVA